jgi:hypothetical protein
MTVSISEITRERVVRFIHDADIPREHLGAFHRTFAQTQDFWAGVIEGEVVCIYGIIPPTLASDNAYFWLYTTPALKGNEFLFIRHSQRAVEELLKLYPKIVGHATPGATRSIRWLRWLGAVFKETNDGLIPFSIRAKKNG